jgi:iron complex outermembrane receptor protein
VNLAARNSDYSTSGSKATYKVSALWRPIQTLSLRSSFSTGIRAPGIGELFGGAAREDFLKLDPCVDYTATLGSINGGRDTAQPQPIQDSCLSNFSIQPGLSQPNPQLSAVSQGNAALTPEESDNWTAGFVYSPQWAEGLGWSEGMTLSVDYYNLVIDNAVQGRDPGDVIDACVATGDPFFCDNVPRTVTGNIGLVNNQLDNIGGIDTSGVDVMFSYASPETRAGSFGLTVNATYLEEYVERSTNPDGTEVSNDRTGIHTDETFPRAFPEWRAVTSIDWALNRWSGGLHFRWVDNMTLDGGESLDSATFTDIRATYNPSFADGGLTVTLGFNNVFDEDPPVCFPCGVIGLSTVSHDLPGRVGYLRVSYQQ